MWRVEKLMCNEHLNKYDEEFVSLVYKDIDGFLKERTGRCVLIFPSLDNRRRYLIHKIGELLSVHTFSVGEGTKRTTVVYNFKSVKQEPLSIENIDASDTHRVMDKNTVNKGAVSKSKRKIRPDAPIYIPPAVRRAQQNDKKILPLEKVKSALPSKLQCNVKEVSAINNKRDCVPAGSGNAENDSKTLTLQENLKPYLHQSNTCTNQNSDKFISIKYTCNSFVKYSGKRLRKRMWCSLPCISFRSNANSTVPDLSVIKSSPDIYKYLKESEAISNTITPTEIRKDTTMSVINNNFNDSFYSECSITSNHNLNEINETITFNNEDTLKNNVITSEKQQLWIDKNSDSDEQELVRASEEINRRNKRIMKQSFSKSDVLIIAEANLEKGNVNIKNTDVDIVDCWEDLVDENGQLDQDLLLEITEHLGDVSISKAKEDYADFKNKTSSDDFSHVVEIYDFPKEFQTRDLVSIFENFKSGNFHIKWVDDNHALGIFSSGFAAKEVVSMKHPLVKVRLFCEASKQSINKAKRYPNAMMPFAVRPQTCPQTARRIVTGALGLKLNNAKEERAQEIKILKEAREKKKLAAKQQDDAWEGKS